MARGKGKEVAQSTAETAWPDDGPDISDNTNQEALYRPLYQHAGILPTHQAEEILLGRLQLEPGVRVTWRVDKDHGSTVFAISEVDNFQNFKRALADQLITDHDLPNYYIDKFVLWFVNHKDEKISSKIPPPGQKKYRKTGTEMSPGTFNILFKAFRTRISPFDKYCVCGDENSVCQGAVRCPQIEVDLAILDDNNERIMKDKKGKNKKSKSKNRGVDREKLDPDRIVRVALEASNASHRGIAGAPDPQLIIPAVCLRRLMSKTTANAHIVMRAGNNDTSPDEGQVSEGPKQAHDLGQQNTQEEGDMAMTSPRPVQDSIAAGLRPGCGIDTNDAPVGLESEVGNTNQDELSTILRRNFADSDASIRSNSGETDADMLVEIDDSQEIIDISDDDHDDDDYVDDEDEDEDDAMMDESRAESDQNRGQGDSDRASTASLDSVEKLQESLRTPWKIRRW